MEKDIVQLISSGYEWTCPNCETLNNEIETTAQVKCASCRNEYQVDHAAHAHE